MKGSVPFFCVSLVALGSLILEYLRQASSLMQSNLSVAFGLFVAAWLFWSRRDELVQKTVVDNRHIERVRLTGDPHAIVIAGVVGLALAVGAQLVHWPYLAWLAFLYWVGLLVYAEFGKPGFVAVRPIVILLIFLNPVPMPCEPWCCLALQTTSTSLTMIMLDFLKVFFFSEGNVLGLISQQKLFPELFQGVSGLVPAIFIVIAWGIHFRYGWIRTVFNVCQAIGWVIVANASVAAVFLANKEAGGTWLDFPSVVVLGDYLKLAFVLFFAWSGDQFLSSTLRSNNSDAGFRDSEIGKTELLFPMRWRVTGPQYALLVGLGVVSILSFRLAPYYQLGMRHSPLVAASMQLPEDMGSWKIEPVNANEEHLWGNPRNFNRFWSFHRGSEKLMLQVTESSTPPKPYLYEWFWTGWRLEKAPLYLAAEDSSPRAMLAELTRLPGEMCTVIAVGSDQYGLLSNANSTSDSWQHLPMLVRDNLFQAFGSRVQDAGSNTRILPPSHTVFLFSLTSKPLSTEEIDELKKVWNIVYPRIKEQLDHSASR